MLAFILYAPFIVGRADNCLRTFPLPFGLDLMNISYFCKLSYILVIWNTLVGEETFWVLLFVGPAGSCLEVFSLPNWLSFVPVFFVTDNL